MLERDYILRMFQMLGQALSRIVFFKETKGYAQALVEIDKAAPAILGLSVDMIERIPVSGLRDVLGSDPALLHSKLYAAGVLLKEKAEILELQEESDGSARLYMKSLVLFVEDLSPLKDREDDREIKSIDFAIEKLKEYELPVELKHRLVLYFEIMGRYDQAENTVFEIVDDDRGYLKEGISFYERLLLKSDSELESGRLPRNEVEESLAVLQKRSAD
ncbi:MAG: DUF6483 family protein [Bacteroidetes bacterium]|nr:DUF6483 family protein [Bacteroidota bacterium]